MAQSGVSNQIAIATALTALWRFSRRRTQRRQLRQITERLEILGEDVKSTVVEMVDQDGEQEVRGIAVPVLNAVVEEIKVALRDDLVVRTVSDVISPEAAAAGEPIRAVDALLIAEQLDAAIGRRPTANATAYAAGVAMRRRLFER